MFVDCLRQVTFQNEENQNYLLEYSCGRLVDATLRLLRLLAREVTLYSHMVAKDSLGHILSEALSNLMKVIMNLTHDNNDECIVSFFSLKNKLYFFIISQFYWRLLVCNNHL